MGCCKWWMGEQTQILCPRKGSRGSATCDASPNACKRQETSGILNLTLYIFFGELGLLPLADSEELRVRSGQLWQRKNKDALVVFLSSKTGKLRTHCQWTLRYWQDGHDLDAAGSKERGTELHLCYPWRKCYQNPNRAG